MTWSCRLYKYPGNLNKFLLQIFDYYSALGCYSKYNGILKLHQSEKTKYC